MIRSFRDRDTRLFWEGGAIRRFSPSIEKSAIRKLRLLNNAASLADLRIPPGNRLEALHGDRRGQWSIRINDQWRICFVWRDADAFDVEIIDYH